MKRISSERPKSTQLHNEMDVREGKTTITYGLCKQPDHNRLFSPMCFINNYIAFVLSVIDMVLRGLHDADPLDPSVLVLQDRHRSHLVDTEQICILLLIN